MNKNEGSKKEKNFQLLDKSQENVIILKLPPIDDLNFVKKMFDLIEENCSFFWSIKLNDKKVEK